MSFDWTDKLVFITGLSYFPRELLDKVLTEMGDDKAMFNKLYLVGNRLVYQLSLSVFTNDKWPW